MACKGGQPGATGENLYFPAEGEALAEGLRAFPRREDGAVVLPGKVSFAARRGSRVGIATPGGGGYGKAE